MQDTSAVQYEITDSPSDGIASLAFHPQNSHQLLASSWDSTVRLYDVEQNRQITRIDHDGPVLEACFGGGSVVYSGGVCKQVSRIDLETSTRTTLGRHDGSVRNVCWNEESGSVLTGSWDKTLRVWDPRADTKEMQKIELPHKVFCMDIVQNILVIAMANRQVYIYDTRNMAAPWQERETSLRYMLKSIRCMPNIEGYACASVEGRVALEFFDMSPEIQAKKYAFKSHRQTVGDTEIVYPVNALAFHPIYGTFASGGSDSIVNIWDGVHRKRTRQFPRYPDEISSLAFSPDGNMLAIASSYTYDEGERDHSPDSIFIRTLAESDCKPRAVANGH
ncbi:mitotic checkpoint protein [Spinellus fusiger]|nr:mitotic checkpoint protein [Spinellus fusiger]